MIERQNTETTAEVYAEEERVLLRMHRKRTELAPAEARQLAQELLDAAEEAEEFVDPTPVPQEPPRHHPALGYYDLPTTPIPYDHTEGA